MTATISNLRVNSDRMLAAFNQLALIGATSDGGVSRVTFGEPHLAARNWFREQIEQRGLEFRTDGAGNHSGFLEASIIARAAARTNPQLNEKALSSQKSRLSKTLLIGSHLDAVPNGGRFAGALGVMAALEVLRTVKENGIKLNVNLQAIDFTDEEGTLVGLLGSAALAGCLDPEALRKPRGGRENPVAGMKRAGLSEGGMLKASLAGDSLVGYLELHIEQGKRLEQAGINIGIVSAIVGIRSYLLSFIGRADHAGSARMDDRLDASLGASAFTLAARQIVMKDFPECVANVGRMDFSPGAFNIVPARADLSLEFRSPDDNELERLDHALRHPVQMRKRPDMAWSWKVNPLRNTRRIS